MWQLPASARENARSAVVASVVSPVGKRQQRGDDVGAIGAAFERERALPDGGQAVLRIEQRRDPLAEAQPLQTRGGEDDRVVLALVELAQPRVDVAAQRHDRQQRIALAQLRFAAQARRADARAARQLGEIE